MCAGCHNNMVGLDLGDQLGSDGNAGLDLDAAALALLSLPEDSLGELFLLGCLAGQDKLTAHLVAGFVDGGIVAAGLQELCANQAADAGADDHDVLGALGLGQALVLQAEHGVAGAGDVAGFGVDNLVVAALGAADAAADFVVAAFLCLVAPLGIDQLAAAHGDHVDLALANQLVSNVGGVDTAHADDGNADAGLDGGDIVHIEAGLQVVGGNLVNGSKAHGVAAGQVSGVYAGLGCPVDELDGLFQSGDLGHQLVDGIKTHQQRHILGHIGAHLADDFQIEAAAVLQALVAVLVGTVVQAGVHELVGQVSMGSVELQCVKAGFHSQFGGSAVLLDDLLNTLVGDGIGSLSLVGLVKEGFGNKAAVPDLDAGQTAVVVDSLGDLLQLVSVVLVVQAQVQISMGLRADTGRLHNIQRAAAGRTDAVVNCQILGDIMLILDHLGVHAGQNNAVFQLKPSQLDGGKQCIVAHN